MSIENRNSKMKSVLIMTLLIAIVIVIFGGVYMLEQAAPVRGDEISRSFNPIQFESAQTGPTGRMVVSTGIILLLLGLGLLVLLVWLGWARTHYPSSGRF